MDMTSLISIEPTKVLAIYPCTRGFSYVVMEDPLTLVEYNLVSPKKFDREKLVNEIKRVINTHNPVTVVLENCDSKYCRKGKRTKNVINVINEWSTKKGVPVKQYSRDDVRKVFEKWYARTKYEIALVITRNIPELRQYTYEKPKYPEREANTSALFSVTSLAITHFFFANKY